ncbi:MAG: reverse transcriptase domain-containing protein [bacterium]
MTTPITLQRSYDVAKVEKQKNKIIEFGDSTDLSIPILSSVSRGSAEQMLIMIKTFLSASKFAKWTSTKTFLKFDMHLQGTANSTWQTILSRSEERTFEQFNLFIIEFKKKFVKADDMFAMQVYMSDLKKPFHMGTSEFFQRFAELNMLLKEFPNAAKEDQIQEQECKRILLRAMPSEWQRSFALAGKRVQNISLLELEEYMAEVETFSTHQKEKFKGKDKKKESNVKSDSEAEKKKKKQPKSKKPTTQRKRLEDSDECPIHGRHKWGQCFDNRNGDNYKPPSTSKQTTSKKPKAAPKKSDAHATQTIQESDDDEIDNENYFCQKCSLVEEKEPFDFHFFDAETEMETENYDVKSRISNGPLQVDLPSKSIELESTTARNSRKERALRRQQNLNLAPETLMTVRRMGESVVRKHYNVLLDSGSTVCMIAFSCIPDNVAQRKTSSLSFQTTNGVMKSSSMVYLNDIHLPEFSKTRCIPEFEAYVYDDSSGKGSYDVILGRDFLFEIGLTPCFLTKMMKWEDVSVPFHKRGHWRNLSHIQGLLENQPYRVEERENDLFSSQHIADAKYDAADPIAIANQQVHLSENHRQKLSLLFQKYSKLFDGSLGKYPQSQVHLKLKPNATPIHAKPFPVPRIYLTALRTEINRLVELDVLEPTTASQWASPAFIIPKRDGSARFIADFRGLNRNLERDLCPLPDMKQIIQEQQNFTYITKLDLSMGYFHLELDETSRALCTIVVPWGKYRFKRLPLGVHPAVDIFQAVMQHLFQDFDKVRTFLDDLKLCTAETFEDHIEHLEKILQVLLRNGLLLNIKKCEWAVQSTEYLGFVFTTNGIKPQQSKIKSILQLEIHQDRKQVRHFVGLVNYYKNMWPKRAHILSPLTSLTSIKNPFKWTEKHTKAFNEMKSLVNQDDLLRFPDEKVPFDIYTDASESFS